MENVTITFNTILQLFGAVAVVGGGVKVLVSLFNPFRELKSQVDFVKGKLANDYERLERGDEKMKELDEKIDKLDEGMSLIGMSVSEMINHMATGNDIEELKRRKKELDSFFYNGKECHHE